MSGYRSESNVQKSVALKNRRRQGRKIQDTETRSTWEDQMRAKKKKLAKVFDNLAEI